MLAILICACARTQGARGRLRLLAACVLPGLLVSIFLSAPAVLHWPGGELDYGAHSLRRCSPPSRKRRSTSRIRRS